MISQKVLASDCHYPSAIYKISVATSSLTQNTKEDAASSSSSPKPRCDILKLSFFVLTIKTLVGLWRLQRSQMTYIWAYLYIIEVSLVNQ